MLVLLYLAIFIFGTCAGSFLNCLVYRLEQGKFSLRGRPRTKTYGLVRGRSFCPKCKHRLGAWDLIPVLSFIVLKRKCRYCGKKISWQYPLVEIATGMIFALVTLSATSVTLSATSVTLSVSEGSPGLAMQTIVFLVYSWTISSLLVIVFLYDLKHYIIPDKIIYPAVGLVLVYNFQFLISKQFSIFQFSVLSAFAAAIFFFLIWFVSRGRWMGFGDVKLAFLIGLFLGWPGILVGLFSAFLIGSLVGVVLILLAKKKLKSQVPFGPFLITGTFIALFWGKEIINWYLNLAT